MEIEAPTRGLPGMLILCRSQLVLGSLLLILGKYWTPLHHATPFPVHLPSHHCSLFGGKGRATDLKQELLGRQPKHLFTFHQKKKCLFFLFPSLFSFGVIWHSPPLGVSPCLFHRGQWKSQAWGGRWVYRSLGEFVDFGVSWKAHIALASYTAHVM